MKRFETNNYFSEIAKIASGFIDSPEYKTVVDILLECHRRGGIVFTMGCGGSASTATHFAADLAKTVSMKHGFKAISLVDNIPLVSAWTNDAGWDSVFEGQLKSWLSFNDVLVGFSVHGGRADWSNNLTKAMKYANKIGACTIGFAGFDGGAMKKMADVCLVVPTDSEVYGTPLVEAMHVVINHSIIWDLKKEIK